MGDLVEHLWEQMAATSQSKALLVAASTGLLLSFSALIGKQSLLLWHQHSGLGLLLVAGIFILTACLAVYISTWRRSQLYDLPRIPGPIDYAHPVFGNLFELLRPDFHKVLLQWTNKYGGIFRARVLWWDGLMVTDPAALAVICGRGEGAMDKAAVIYGPVNQMCSPSAHPNLLTSPADPAWRTVRKAVAAAFSFQAIRKKYPVVRGCTETLISQLAASAQAAQQGGQAPAGPAPITVDVDQAALRVTLDVIGLAGFGHDFRSLHQGGATTCSAPAPPGHLLRVLPRCFTEVMRRLVNPARLLTPGLYKTGPRGAASFAAFQREMKVLLRECLSRDQPPPADDLSIGAQLWRIYHSQDPPPPPPAATPLGSPEYEATAGGLLPPPPQGLASAAWRLSQLLASIRGTHQAGYEGTTSRAGGKPLLLSAERILSEIGILFVEGFETTGHTISWTLLNVATVPGVQDCIAAELDSLGLLAHPPQHTAGPSSPGAKPTHLGKMLPVTSTSQTTAAAAEEPTSEDAHMSLVERLAKAVNGAAVSSGVGKGMAHEGDSLSSRPTGTSTVSSTCFTSSGGSGDVSVVVGLGHTKTGDSLPAANKPPLLEEQGNDRSQAPDNRAAVGDGASATGHVAHGLQTIGPSKGGTNATHSVLEQTPTSGPAAAPPSSCWPLPRSVELDDLPRLRYLSACIKEAMRMLPVVSVMSRISGATPTRVGPYLIPPHTPVAIPLYCIQNSSHNWDRASEYLPERWLQVPAETFVTGPLGTAPVKSVARRRTGAKAGAGADVEATGGAKAGAEAPGAPASLQAVAAPPAGPVEPPQQEAQATERKQTRHPSLETIGAAAARAAASAAEQAQERSRAGGGGTTRKPTRHLSLEKDPLEGGARRAGYSGAAGIAFMPFSEGPRNCVGQTLAKIEVATVLASILGAFRVELAPETGGREGISARESTHLTLQTAGTQGIRMALYPRWL